MNSGNKNLKFLILILFYLIQPFSCYVYIITNSSNFGSDSSGILDDSDFDVTFGPIDNSTKTPSSLRIVTKIKNWNFDITVNRLDGVMNNPALKNSLYVTSSNNRLSQPSTRNLPYTFYRDEKKIAYATLIPNTDLTDLGANITQKFRVLASILYNGSKIDITPILISSIPNKVSRGAILKESYSIYADNSTGVINDLKGDIIEEQIKMHKTERRKRAINGRPVTFWVEYLIVIDSSVYNKFLGLFSSLGNDLMFQYIKIYYCHIVNGIDSRYQNSFLNDTDMRINVRLSNLLIYTNPADTPWTNSSIVGVPNQRIYNGKETILSSTGLTTFTTAMNSRKFNFTYDHAVAIVDKDLWSTLSGTSGSRSAVTGYAIVGGICGVNKYSIVEEVAFNNIQNAAHELGHNLGAPHDGVGVSINCSPALNYIMTPNIGAYNLNLLNLLSFSPCSINAFKSRLFNSSLNGVLPSAQCLLNVPIDTLSSYFNTSLYLPGQLYSLDDQCRLLLGPNSSYAKCRIANDPVCTTLYCFEPVSKNCIGATGLGALDGSSCGTGRVCLKGICVNSTSIITNKISSSPCIPNPCLNGGSCLKVNNFYLCNCTASFTGQNCETNIPTTTKRIL